MSDRMPDYESVYQQMRQSHSEKVAHWAAQVATGDDGPIDMDEVNHAEMSRGAGK